MFLEDRITEEHKNMVYKICYYVLMSFLFSCFLVFLSFFYFIR